MLWLIFQIAFTYQCGEWQALEGDCYFAGKPATFWHRYCENPYVDHTELCSPEDPATFEADCTKWYRNKGLKCLDADGKMAPSWQRVCTRRFATTQICTFERNPNQP